MFLKCTFPHFHPHLFSAGSCHLSPGAPGDHRLALAHLDTCFRPVPTLSKTVWLCYHQPTHTKKLLKGQLKGALILVIPATLTIRDLLWAMEHDQRWHVPWLRRSPKGIFFNLSPAMKWPHGGQPAQSQDITWTRNRHLLLEATEILVCICYTALSSKCQLTHGASQYS